MATPPPSSCHSMANLAAPSAPPTMQPTQLQRRYSVTGQTPPDDVGAVVKSPKLQDLDTSSNCQLCDTGRDDGASPAVAVHATQRRTSSKRSATQLPSPTTPSSHTGSSKNPRLGHRDEDRGWWRAGEAAAWGMEVTISRGAVGTGQAEDGKESLECECSSEKGLSEKAELGEQVVTLAPISLDQPSTDASLSSTHAFASQTITLTLPPIPLEDPQPASTPALALSPSPHPDPIEPSPSPSTPTPSQAPTFTTLPLEIRHLIYLHLPDLIRPYPLIYCRDFFSPSSLSPKQHPLALVSRPLRTEVLAIFYSHNTWLLKLEYALMYDVFQNWIVGIGLEGARNLRVVHLAVRGRMFRPGPSHGGVGVGVGTGSSSSTTAAALQNGLNAMPTGWPISSSTSMAVANATLSIANMGLAVAQLPPPPPPAPTQGARNRDRDRDEPAYQPPDGEATFAIDLSEKFEGGKVDVLRNDGTAEAGEVARMYLGALVRGLWEGRRTGEVTGQDWVGVVDAFLEFVGWR